MTGTNIGATSDIGRWPLIRLGSDGDQEVTASTSSAHASGSASAVNLALDTRAYIENVTLEAQDIRVSADNQITGRFIAGAAAGSGGVGIGASLAVGLLNSTATAEVLGSTLNATQDIDVTANQRMDMGVTVATGAAGLGAVAGAVSVMMADAVTVARVASSQDGRHSVLDAGRDIDVNATTTTLLNQRSSPADYLQAVVRRPWAAPVPVPRST